MDRPRIGHSRTPQREEATTLHRDPSDPSHISVTNP